MRIAAVNRTKITFQVVIRTTQYNGVFPTRGSVSLCVWPVVVFACSAFRALLQIRAMRKKLSPLSPSSFNPVITSQTSDSEDNSVRPQHTHTHARKDTLTRTHTHTHTHIDRYLTLHIPLKSTIHSLPRRYEWYSLCLHWNTLRHFHDKMQVCIYIYIYLLHNVRYRVQI